MAFTDPHIHDVTAISAIASSHHNGMVPFGAVRVVFKQRPGETAEMRIFTTDPDAAHRIAAALNAAFPAAEQESA